MASETDTWLPFDHDVVAQSEWAVRPLPGLIAEPEPPPPPPEPPAWFVEAIPGPVPRRRRRGRRLVRAVVLVVALALLGSGAAAYFTGAFPGLEDEGTARRQGQPPARPTERAPEPAPVAVVGSNGERHTCTKLGTDGDNELTGTAGRDILCGLGGADTIRGGDENDLLLGGNGNDVLIGGPGNDQLDGGAGRDTLHVRDGFRDRTEGGPGRDVADTGWLDARSKGVESRADPVVVAAGDIACDPAAESFRGGEGTEQRCRQMHTAALIQGIEPDKVLVLGDAQYENARLRAYDLSYDPSWGRFKKISHPTPAGLHDRYGGGGFRRYWKQKARPQGLPYYSVDVGAWHVVSLNSNCTLVGGCNPGSPQEQWLRADLASNQARCELAFWHEPLIGSNEPASQSIEPIWQALYDSGVDVVLNGDSHLYERMKPMTPQRAVDPARGIRQFIVGTGGRSLDPFERRLRITSKRQATAFGVLKLRLRRASYEWEFVPEVEQTFRDNGRGKCH